MKPMAWNRLLDFLQLFVVGGLVISGRRGIVLRSDLLPRPERKGLTQ